MRVCGAAGCVNSRMYYALHKFRPTETIDAVMRLKGRHNYSKQELASLRVRFNELNGTVVPRVGDIYKIPLEQLTVDDYGTVVDVSVLFPVEPDPARESQEPANGERAGDPRQPDRELPPEPHPTGPVEDASQQHGDQHVTPDPGEQPGQKLDQPKPDAVQPTLMISGARRKRPAPAA